jgi:hypothetical protein
MLDEFLPSDDQVLNSAGSVIGGTVLPFMVIAPRLRPGYAWF